MDMINKYDKYQFCKVLVEMLEERPRIVKNCIDSKAPRRYPYMRVMRVSVGVLLVAKQRRLPQ